MSSRSDDPYGTWQTHTEYVPAEVVPEPHDEPPPRRIPMLPVMLFLAACYTTYRAGLAEHHSPALALAYSLPLMGTLLCHEFGHYIQARRYHVPASLPIFIPMPFGPIGTMGAVIAMRGHMGNRKALFDIGISGPLAGLVPTLLCCVVGLSWSERVEIPQGVPFDGGTLIGVPLLFRFLEYCFFGPSLPGHALLFHPLAFAGWVGVFITALNLIPISQLDGGHVLYAIMREKVHLLAWAALMAAFAGVILTGRYEWSLMLFLLVMMGPAHPPTADDNMPLGSGRIILGWLTLSFVIIGFTPTPFV